MAKFFHISQSSFLAVMLT